MAVGSSESQTRVRGEAWTGDSRSAACMCLQAAGSGGAKGCRSAVLAVTGCRDNSITVWMYNSNTVGLVRDATAKAEQEFVLFNGDFLEDC